jgi:AraC-like DNA-binding protein/ligand-binding sensor protein
MSSQEFETAENRALQKLTDSSFFRTWKRAFALATGLEAELVPAEPEELERQPDPRSANLFCRSLQGCQACCHDCRVLVEDAAERPATTKCFAGMRETAIPVRVGDHPMAYLIAGQVFDHTPTETEFNPVEARLRRDGFSATQISGLRQAFVSSPVMEPERFHAATTLLVTFSLQLAAELNRLLLAETNADSPTIIRAKQFIIAHLDERITLDDVAAHVCVSPFYFCKIFKQATGMTLTEYVNRRRVEWAKRKLLNPHARVTEVAFDVGYQSLSQFNRSFLRYAGESPTKFREQVHTTPLPHAA